jgi:hypothetical protein
MYLIEQMHPVVEISVGQGGGETAPNLYGGLMNFRKFQPKRRLKTTFLSANGEVCRKFEGFVGYLGGFAPHWKK